MTLASRRLGRAAGTTGHDRLGGRGPRRRLGETRPMENALLIGLSRQIALHRELEVVANNIANLEHHRLQGRRLGVPRIPDAGRQRRPFQGADRRLSYVHDRATWHDFSPGPIQQTGNPLDVAIDGDAFLVVQTPRGERYTRNGALQINANGELVTSEGDRVQGDGGPIQFQTTDRDISINADGSITVREGANTKTDSARGKLRLVRFDRVQPIAEGRIEPVRRAQRLGAAAGGPERARRARARSSSRTCAASSRWRA